MWTASYEQKWNQEVLIPSITDRVIFSCFYSSMKLDSKQSWNTPRNEKDVLLKCVSVKEEVNSPLNTSVQRFREGFLFEKP